jgi:hypothetical protein
LTALVHPSHSKSPDPLLIALDGRKLGIFFFLWIMRWLNGMLDSSSEERSPATRVGVIVDLLTCGGMILMISGNFFERRGAADATGFFLSPSLLSEPFSRSVSSKRLGEFDGFVDVEGDREPVSYPEEAWLDVS